ncbi:MAG: biliverdin-producing heme oxygenase [Bdellovibrionales bacterium]|nr:biliverdin-producing heme oxygenase [Oligoflexia bacterium]
MMHSERELFSKQLRIQTAEAHERLDHSFLLSKIAGPSLTLDEYKLIVSRHAQSFFRVENALFKAGGEALFTEYFYSSRLPGLKKDLQTLGLPEPGLKDNGNSAQTSIATAVGMFYVLHGSCLGGQMIAKHLRGRMPEDALNFYGGSSAHLPAWAEFKEKIDSEQNTLSLSQAVAGARLAFETFSEIFQEA